MFSTRIVVAAVFLLLLLLCWLLPLFIFLCLASTLPSFNFAKMLESDNEVAGDKVALLEQRLPFSNHLLWLLFGVLCFSYYCLDNALMTAEMTGIYPGLLPPPRKLNIATIHTTKNVMLINTKTKPLLPNRLKGTMLNSHTEQSVIIYSCDWWRITFHRSLSW